MNPEAQQQEPQEQQEMIEVKTDKVATLQTQAKNDVVESHSPAPRKELNVRAKKSKHGDRAANKGDGSLVLVLSISCSFFCVSLMALHTNLIVVRPAPIHTP